MHFPAKYSIKDLEQLSGIKAHTIRIWEKRFGVIEPDRTDTNIRLYSNDDLRRLLNISLLNKHGIKISEIAQMNESQIAEKVSAINLVKTDESNLIESLIIGMIDMNERQFDRIFTACILRMGFENTILKVVFPFLTRIGIMWQTGSINPAQEHFVSNIIRQKIIVATDSLGLVNDKNAPTALLFLPENELHEMSLLFYNYALRSRNYKTIYLGQSVPSDNLSRIVKITCPDLLITVISTKLSILRMKDLFFFLSGQADNKKVLISGQAALESKLVLPDGMFYFSDLKQLIRLI
jgi:DNA-binding transcriptional MerR regulator